MFNVPLNTDYIVFCDVYSFEVFRRGENNIPVLVAMHSAYQTTIAVQKYESELIQSLKNIITLIKKDWTHSRMPTVSLVLSDTYTHTVFHHVTHTFSKEKQVTPAMIDRAIKADLRTRAWNAATADLPDESKYYGYVDTAVFALTINGYSVSLPMQKSAQAREYAFLYGASICSRKLYTRVSDLFHRSNISIGSISSFALLALRAYDHTTTRPAHALFALQDTVTSLYVVHGTKIASFSMPVGLHSFFAEAGSSFLPSHKYTHMLLANVHGVAKRHNTILQKNMHSWFHRVYQAYQKDQQLFLQAYPAEQLEAFVPYIGEKDSAVQSAIQMLLYPGALQYTQLRQPTRMLFKSKIISAL